MCVGVRHNIEVWPERKAGDRLGYAKPPLQLSLDVMVSLPLSG
jgi:hypothetical protein